MVGLIQKGNSKGSPFLEVKLFWIRVKNVSKTKNRHKAVFC